MSNIQWDHHVDGGWKVVFSSFKSLVDYVTERYGYTLPDAIEPSTIGRDISSEAEGQSLIQEFRPSVKLRGIGLRNERDSLIWAGAFSRALKDENSKTVVLQYLYVYMHQQGLLSPIINGAIPFLMGVWAYFTLGIYQGSDIIFIFAANAAFAIPILITGISPHIRDLNTRGLLHPRVTTLLIGFAPLMLTVPKTAAATLYFDILSIPIILNVPLFMILFGGLVFIFGILYSSYVLNRFQFRRMNDAFPKPLGAHEMDYVPVFVWIRRNQAGIWKIQAAAWDYHHYNVASKVHLSLSRERARTIRDRAVDRVRYRHLSSNKRVRLYIDSPWHSLTLGIEVGRPTFGLIIAGLLIILVDWFVNQASSIFTLHFFLIVFFSVFIILYFLRLPYKLGVGDEIADVDHIMTETDLSKLWFLNEEDPKLKIRKKLQEALHCFDGRKVTMKTFNDHWEDQNWHLITIIYILIMVIADAVLFYWIWFVIP
jgi:hypothetical protein